MARRSKYLFRVKGLDGTWVAEAVNGRMSSPCAACGEKPATTRIVHKSNPDPFPKSTIYCTVCACGAATSTANRAIRVAQAAAAEIAKAIDNLP